MGNKTRSVVGVSSKPFHCELCQVSVNSETQLKQVCGFILDEGMWLMLLITKLLTTVYILDMWNP